MGACFVCYEGSRQAHPFFISHCSEWNIDSYPTPRNLSPKLGAGVGEIKSGSKRNILKADGTLLVEEHVTTHNPVTNRVKHSSLNAKDYPTSTQSIKTSSECVLQEACSNSIIEKSESASGPSAAEESADATLDSAGEGETNTYVIPEDKRPSAERRTPDSSLRKPESKLVQQAESWTEDSLSSVFNSKPVREGETLLTNELNTTRGEAPFSKKNSLKTHSINKRCVGVENKLGKKSTTGTESIISPARDSNIVSQRLETSSGMTKPSEFHSSVEIENETNYPSNFSPQCTPINIKPIEVFKSELARMQEKDEIIKQLQIQNERLKESMPARRLRSRNSSVFKSGSGSDFEVYDGRPCLSTHWSRSSLASEMLHQKLRDIKQSVSVPESPVSQTSNNVEGSAWDDNEEVKLPIPFKFLPAEESREKRSSSNTQDKKPESSSNRWEFSGLVTLK